MRIFLDGCDGSGKSTLATYLSTRFKIDKFCLTKESEKSVERYASLLSIDNVVYDRTFLSEVVYPKVFERQEWLNKYYIDNLIDEYCNKGLFVICTAPNDVLKARIQSRGDEYKEVIDKIEYINDQYMTLAVKYNLIIADTYEMSLEAIARFIERR